MSLLDHPAVYDDLLDVLAESANAERLLAFRLSEPLQARLDVLLEKNREGTLTHEEMAERARSHLYGQVSNRAKCEVAIRFNRFQRPAL